MNRSLLPVLLALTMSLAALAANMTIVVNGKTVAVPMVMVNGKAYIDAAALAKLLGGMASYTGTPAKLVIAGTPGTVAATATAAPKSSGSAGTAQLAGDNGILGTIYSIRKSDPLYFCLLSAEFTVAPVLIGDDLYGTNADQKLLVLRYTIQNPNKYDSLVRWDSLRMTAVDAMNVNHVCEANWGDAETRGKVEMQLKPAQKLAMYTVISVPAKGTIPKLIVQPWADDGPVLRYDLRDKINTLTAPFADPADASNLTAREEVPAQMNVAYPLWNFNISVEKYDFVTTELAGNTPDADSRFMTATLLVKNVSAFNKLLRWDTFISELVDTDDGKLNYGGMVFASNNRQIEQELKAGKEIRVRIFFTVPKDVTPKTLTIKEGESRSYLFEVK